MGCTSAGREESEFGLTGNGRPPAPDTLEGMVERFRQGDADAFDDLFRHYQAYIYNICWGILADPEDAEDATQETFLRAYRGCTQFRGQAQLTTWLYRIAVNTALRRESDRRKRAWRPLEEAPAEEEGPHVAWSERVEEMERTRRVRAVLQALPAGYRAVLVLRYFHDLTHAEMAEVLAVSVSSAKVRLHRARRAFHDRYHALFGEEER